MIAAMATTGRADTSPVEATDGRLGGNAASIRATAAALAKAGSAAAVVLVEGISDQIAVESAALAGGRDLAAERVVVVPIGGAHAIGRFLTRLAPLDTRVRLAGLCDLLEEEVFRRALVAAGVGAPGNRAEMARRGFQVCVKALEDELLRALGPAGVEALLETQGDLRSFRSFQSQPAWRGQEPQTQLWRFLRSSSRRNLRYARLLVEEAVRRDVLPRPLDALLVAV